jgi:hypothetical protein
MDWASRNRWISAADAMAVGGVSSKWTDLPPGMEGILGSFSTRRIGGFTNLEIEYLKALSAPLSLAIKSMTLYELANALLDTYLGRYSGRHVLDGLVGRGDGRLIDCVLWFCDLIPTVLDIDLFHGRERATRRVAPLAR